MAWMTGPFGPLQSTIRANDAQIAANDETLRRPRAESDEDQFVYRVSVTGPGGEPLPDGATVTTEAASEPVRAPWCARRPWWRRIWRRR